MEKGNCGKEKFWKFGDFGKWKLQKMEIVENRNCRKQKLWGKKLWKMKIVENENYGKQKQ